VPVTVNKYYNGVMVRVSVSLFLRSSILNTQYSNAVPRHTLDTPPNALPRPPFSIPCNLKPTLHPSASTRRTRKVILLNPPYYNTYSVFRIPYSTMTTPSVRHHIAPPSSHIHARCDDTSPSLRARATAWWGVER
jgi:hypothetical protein